MNKNTLNIELCYEYVQQRRKYILSFFIGFASTAILTNFVSTVGVIIYGVICFISVLCYGAHLGFGNESERNYFGRYTKKGREDQRYTKHISYKEHTIFKGHRVSEIKQHLKENK
ncbi:hypothetical protein [Paraglaciecola psychrophila]|uniref:Uncharacterized protein n=1 Tax=Paraglaciecola psychrophila 170 TaxID=1129794 RepID=K6ZNK6_9ALTE|nr:hypothetical protein [Paraglaciecola psychrophila]AGH45843.1 hypothetical protein C427_3735 [Paraglaciecola psychrophila 170]GAC37536.1 hypothetical protein GPSY_1912 [Paraglaciecola psychrophila 170]